MENIYLQSYLWILSIIFLLEYHSLVDMISSNSIFQWNDKIIGKSDWETEFNLTGNLYQFQYHLLTVAVSLVMDDKVYTGDSPPPPAMIKIKSAICSGWRISWKFLIWAWCGALNHPFGG